MQMRMETTIKDLLTSAGFQVGVNAVAGNRNAVSINSSSHETIDSASDLLLEIMEGDMVKIDEEVNNSGIKVIMMECI